MSSSAIAITRRRRALETAIAVHLGTQGDSSGTTQQTLTDSAVSTLVPCLEEFIRALSNELAANNPASSEKMKQVSSQSVVAALNKMGFGELAVEASELLQQQQPQPQAQANRKKRKQEFSQEQADAQELLLAASKRKMEGEPT
jgi:hypothetical protein